MSARIFLIALFAVSIAADDAEACRRGRWRIFARLRARRQQRCQPVTDSSSQKVEKKTQVPPAPKAPKKSDEETSPGDIRKPQKKSAATKKPQKIVVKKVAPKKVPVKKVAVKPKPLLALLPIDGAPPAPPVITPLVARLPIAGTAPGPTAAVVAVTPPKPSVPGQGTPPLARVPVQPADRTKRLNVNDLFKDLPREKDAPAEENAQP